MDKATAVLKAVKEVSSLMTKHNKESKQLAQKQREEIVSVCKKHGVSQSHIHAVIMGYTKFKREGEFKKL